MDSDRVITVATTLILGAIAAAIVLVLSSRLGGAVAPTRIEPPPPPASQPAEPAGLSAGDVERIAAALARRIPTPAVAAVPSCCRDNNERKGRGSHWKDPLCADPELPFTYRKDLQCDGVEPVGETR